MPFLGPGAKGGVLMREKRELVVFVASPGDVGNERNTVERVASNLNTLLSGRLDVVVTVRRWEQLAPGAGRPQDRINPMVDDCHVFIGILRRRWGAPPGGEKRSGFEEEFNRALARWRSSGVPNVAIFLGDVDKESQRDPGPQLGKVLEFRSLVEREHSALYKPFRGPDDFEIQVQTLLTGEMRQLADADARGAAASCRRSPVEAQASVKPDGASGQVQVAQGPPRVCGFSRGRGGGRRRVRL